VADLTVCDKSFILKGQGLGGVWRRKGAKMGFLNAFVSYLLLLIVFVIVGGAAVFLGITLRKNANAKAEMAETAEVAAESEQAAN
jgi:hypothetical protein